MSNVTPIKLARDPLAEKSALLNTLTSLLLDVQEGRCTQFVMMAVVDENFKTYRGNASKMECIAMSAMLHSEAINMMRV